MKTNENLYFNIVSELVSNGCVVYCVNHSDRTALNHVKADGTFVDVENPEESEMGEYEFYQDKLS